MLGAMQQSEMDNSDVLSPLVVFTGGTVICAVKDQVTADVSDEAVILHLQKGMYYGLDPVGASIWKLIQTPKTFNEIRDAILNEYEVETDRCARDLRDLLKDLQANELIQVSEKQNA